MGAAESVPDVGYHVLEVAPNSPGERAGLVSFFDFIITANSHPLNVEDSTLLEILRENVCDEVKLQVFNTREGNLREVSLIPSNSWGGAGFAGISVRFCSLAQANEHVWHVLSVHTSSPAEVAGLESYTDYIVGTPELLFNDQEDFYALVRANEGSGIPLYVYSTVTDSVRLVTISPNNNWGGHGSLGCDVGYGYLHRIPTKKVEKNIQSEDTEASNTQELDKTSITTNQTQPNTTESKAPPSPHLTTAKVTDGSSVNEHESVKAVPPEFQVSPELDHIEEEIPKHYRQQVYQEHLVQGE